MEWSDEQLVHEAQNGSVLAFEQLMRRYERLVFKVAFGHVGNREGALDICQNVFLKVHRRLGSLRRRNRFKAWLLRVTFHESVNWARSTSRHDHDDLLAEVLRDPLPSQEKRLMRQERKELVLDSMFRLNPKYRMAVTLRYFQEMSIREIAQALGSTEGTVKNMLFRSLRKMRTHLKPTLEVSR